MNNRNPASKVVRFPSWGFSEFASDESRKPCDTRKPDRALCKVAVIVIVEDSLTFRWPRKASTRRKGEAVLVPSSWLASDTFKNTSQTKRVVNAETAARWFLRSDRSEISKRIRGICRKNLLKEKMLNRSQTCSIRWMWERSICPRYKQRCRHRGA